VLSSGSFSLPLAAPPMEDAGQRLIVQLPTYVFSIGRLLHSIPPLHNLGLAGEP
jgi:hypothetical protein